MLKNKIFRDFDNKEKEIFLPATGEIKVLNALKFFCALMVVGIHIPFFLSLHIYFLYRIAVPIFFMVTGFFLINSKGLITTYKIRKTLIKLIKVTLSVNIIYYLIFGFYSANWEFDIINLLLGGSKICIAFWYLNAVIFSLLLLWVLVRLKITVLLPILIIGGIIINLMLGSYSFLFPGRQYIEELISKDHFIYLSRNFITIGIPCIGLGMWFRLHNFSSNNILKLKLCILFLFCLWVENLIHDKFFFNFTGDILFFTVPFSAILFVITTTYNFNNILIRIFSYCGKNLSSYIYLYHILFCWFIKIAGGNLGLNPVYYKYWLLPLTVCLCVICYFIFKLIIQKNIYFNLKKYIFSYLKIKVLQS